MYNLQFTSIEDCMKVNNLSKEQVCYLFKQFLNNQNYRKGYNEQKAQLSRMLKNDPVVKAKLAELKKKLS
jgi:hypothetical protein